MQDIFKRCEEKYLMTKEQHAAIQNTFFLHMEPDEYGEYLVQNLYYDTENWDIIRASLEKLVYKEKLRLRCYGTLEQSSGLYLELKKKYKGVVYKRRIPIPMDGFCVENVRDIVADNPSQIARELDFYLKTNAVSEKIYISYKRSAYAGVEDKNLRVTFDTDVRYRLDLLDYSQPENGYAILPRDGVLMEIKTLGAMPMWMVRSLCENRIFPTSFSKYGMCYIDFFSKQVEFGKTERTVVVSA